jgi:UDP-3-O-[3-hydroxymyristoyl] glucosamine N-acyltransferase
MQFSAPQIAALIDGKIEGDASVSVQAFGKIEEAGPGQLTFLANPKYEEYLYSTGASLVIIGDALKLKQPVKPTLLRVADPYSAFATLLNFYQQTLSRQMTGIQQPSHIDTSAQVGNNVFIGAFAYIGKNVTIGDDAKIYPGVYIGDNVKIGTNTVIHPGVKIYHDCIVGNRIVIHAGAVIGGDGFGFAPQADGSYKKVPQIGNVVIEDNVEIGANTTIDRATIGSTLIKSGAKLDNLIQIAHNVEIGNSSVIAAQVGISGSTRLGNNVMIGGQAGIVGHIHLADGTKINGQSGVSKSVKTPNASLTGSPAHDYTAVLRSQAVFRNLPEMEKKIQELEKLVQELMRKEL